jgi:hypothetical protein
MSKDVKPVLIAHAGPTCIMAAIEQPRFMIPARLIETKAIAETASRAIGIQARTLELLEQRGLGSSETNNVLPKRPFRPRLLTRGSVTASELVSVFTNCDSNGVARNFFQHPAGKKGGHLRMSVQEKRNL